MYIHLIGIKKDSPSNSVSGFLAKSHENYLAVNRLMSGCEVSYRCFQTFRNRDNENDFFVINTSFQIIQSKTIL